MTEKHKTGAVFVTLVSSREEKPRARLLLDSIRSFGGCMQKNPIWLFEADPKDAPCNDLEAEGIRVFQLDLPETVRDRLFASKVFTCARAEEFAGTQVRSLVWLSNDCLIVRPPLLLDLGPSFDAALRPVHIRNVGLPAGSPVDEFWREVYDVVGVKDVGVTVESFVDRERIRAYYNSHAFAVNPSMGLLRRWSECFSILARDRAFLSGPCADAPHQVFLHQAVLSALVVASLDRGRIRNLPPEYNYPYNLHQSVASDRRASVLNDLVLIVYENRTLDPLAMDDISVKEPLRSWLSSRVPSLA